MKKIFLLMSTLLLLLAACGGGDGPAPSAPPTEMPPTLPPATATQPPPTETLIPPTETPEPIPTEKPSLPALPPEPQRIEFQTEDDVTLVGYYYPAAVNPAPVVVLMHWAPGKQTDWLQVGMVSWLQNRGQEVPAAGGQPFDTPYPFTPLPADLSFAVFTFDFRGVGESDGQRLTPPNWNQHIPDARAAYQTAASLEGVDPGQVIGIGASFGGDAVLNGCEDCIGALSLSPGGYLGEPYPEAVAKLDAQDKPVWCVAAQDRGGDARVCESVIGNHYYAQIYPQGGHAMTLFRENLTLDPPIDDLIVEFLKEALSLPVSP
jgi:pimeloyl-ACP methyl ester carboxylesterase